MRHRAARAECWSANGDACLPTFAPATSTVSPLHGPSPMPRTWPPAPSVGLRLDALLPWSPPDRRTQQIHRRLSTRHRIFLRTPRLLGTVREPTLPRAE